MENIEPVSRISDKEFVRLSEIKDMIKTLLYDLLMEDYYTETEFHPDLHGNVYFLVDEETLYCISISIRYVDVSGFKVADKINYELSKVKGIHIPVYMTKDNGILYLKIYIKKEIEE